MRFTSTVALLGALAATATAQTFTDCNPLNKTCPADPALGTKFNQTYSLDSSFDPGLWNFSAGEASFASDSAAFQIVNQGDSVTAQTSFYIFWGRVEVWMQAASGQGIISSLVLLSDDLDEVDWEIMGGNVTHIENNYYGKGDQNERNAQYVAVETGPPQHNFHNYTLDWTQDRLQWWYDGKMVRELTPGDAKDNYPQTPCYFKMGIWAGGDPKEPEGVREWAGGLTDYGKGPFIMHIANLTIEDYTKNASSYTYGDNSGKWQSIKVDKSSGPSEQAKIANAPPPETMEQKWEGYSPAAKIAIIAVPSAIVGVLAIVGLVCCFKHRGMGRRERAIEDAQWEKRLVELTAYRNKMAAGHFAAGVGGYAPVHNPQHNNGGAPF